MSDSNRPDQAAAGPATEEMHVEGIAGEPIDLPIGSGPATGYSWSLDLPDAVVRLPDGPGQAVSPEAALGGSSAAPVRVQARDGRHVLIATLSRPWDREHPARVVKIVLDVRAR